MSSWFLVNSSISVATVSSYSKAVRAFIQWCDRNGYDVHSDEEMDELLTLYFHEMYIHNNGGGKSRANNTFWGILKFRPRYHGKLHCAFASLRGWERLQPATSYPPLTWELTVLIATTMARNGYYHYAVACLVAFDCFLRVGELVNIRMSDIATTADRRIGIEYRGVAIRLRTTKTGKNQWVQVHDKQVQQLLLSMRNASGARGGDNKVFNFTAGSFRSIFKQSCACLHLSSRYVPHSLRHGGATRWHLLGHSVDDILIRGRWSSTKSARRYIQAGRALLLTVDVAPALITTARQLTHNIIHSLTTALSQSH